MVLPQVLVCQKDNNQKTRESAKVLLGLFVKRMAFDDIAPRLEAVLGQTNAKSVSYLQTSDLKKKECSINSVRDWHRNSINRDIGI